MDYEMLDCIDCGSEFCPCKLAENGECILCSQLNGKCFCDCANWKGVCIYQEFANNNFKAKNNRQIFTCDIVKKINLEEDLLLITFSAPHKLCLDLVVPGSYIFIRTDENPYFDVPISILESNIENNEISLLVEVRGIKTKRLLKDDSKIIIRGPYWNGVFGLKNINSTKNSNALILSRGIGIAPMIPVVRNLKNSNNNIDVIIDKSPYNNVPVKDFMNKYIDSFKEDSLIVQGQLPNEMKVYIKNIIEEKNISLIYCAGADILIYNLIDYLNEIGRDDIKLSCCNNSKMCCGEGICGSCTARFKGHKVKRLCKVQTDPRNIFEDRRFI